jgi:NAD(P)-dependent dehydrogenase (short-subunit alcohol dehydrogenase family)
LVLIELKKQSCNLRIIRICVNLRSSAVKSFCSRQFVSIRGFFCVLCDLLRLFLSSLASLCAFAALREIFSAQSNPAILVTHAMDASHIRFGDRNQETTMKIADSTVLVTGANRGIGKALVEEALSRGAKRVYAGARQPFAHTDRRVTPIILDVTDARQIRAAVEKVGALDILINNAGISVQNELSDRAALERLLAVNLFGTYDVTQAFLPVLSGSRSAIVNILSLASMAAVPFDPLYSISKAAAFSLSQSLRALLAGRGVSVHIVLPGPIDTDMTRDLDIPKASPESTARAILDGVEKEEEEIFPDPMSEAVAEGWRNSAVKELQRQFAAYVDQTPVKPKGNGKS